jgi:hypothetical protein
LITGSYLSKNQHRNLHCWYEIVRFLRARLSPSRFFMTYEQYPAADTRWLGSPICAVGAEDGIDLAASAPATGCARRG